VIFDLAGRLREIPYRLRAEHHLSTPIADVSIAWPRVYEWPPCGQVVVTLRDALSRAARLAHEDIPQVHKGVIIFRCDAHQIVLDYSDYHNFVNEDALQPCDLYIKLQYRSEGYADLRIVPGGYPVTAKDFYRFYLPFRHWGNRRLDWDIVGRFGYTFQEQIRRKAGEILNSVPGFSGTGKVRYSRFLREVASSKLALHMPGNGPFTHRVAEFLGLGTCMLSQRFATELHVPLLPGVHYVEIASDLSDLMERIFYYLAHDAERNAIARAGREYFDKYLHADHLAAYYLRRIAELPPPPADEQRGRASGR
jgi:hypothetical protein